MCECEGFLTYNTHMIIHILQLIIEITVMAETNKALTWFSVSNTTLLVFETEFL